MAASIIPSQPSGMSDAEYARAIGNVQLDEHMDLPAIFKQARHLAHAYSSSPYVSSAFLKLAYDAAQWMAVHNHNDMANPFMLVQTCHHVAVDTGMRKTWCRHCGVAGEWTPAGVRWPA